MKFSIIVARDLDGPFTYSSDQPLEVGRLVAIDFRGKDIVGVVVDGQNSDFCGTIKKISLSLPYLLPEVWLRFAKFVSEYNLIKFGTVFKLIVPFSTDLILLPEKDLKQSNPSKAQSIVLSDEQNNAVLEVLKFQNQFKTILLHGVTGSGKTEVFLEVAQKIINSSSSAQVLILVPEIALSDELAKKVASRLGCEVFIWHNTVSKSKKLNIWKKAMSGQKLVIVGARSALFVPFANLSLIVIDEEHDMSFKQSETAIYNARDMAIYLGFLQKIPVILSSATPSLESYYNAITGKYLYIRLNARYFSNATLPEIYLNDLRQEKFDGTLSDYSKNEIERCLSQGRQALIFVNRRGHTPKVLCPSCGKGVMCPSCSSWLCFHMDSNEFVCHYCGFRSKAQKACVNCGWDSLIGIGTGIEKVYEECTKRFPDSRVLMLSSDTINTPRKIAVAIEKIKNNEVDIILGTQIVAKGHNFNNLNLVIVTCADAMLYGDDFRSMEKAFQLMHQVSGRAGRTGDFQSKVIIQTYNPDEYIMKVLEKNEIEKFYETEIKNREKAGMPPFGKMIGITISALSEREVQDFSKKLVMSMPRVKGIRVLGPIQPAIYKLRSRYRLKILLLSKSKLQNYISRITLLKNPPKNIRIAIDVDPQEM